MTQITPHQWNPLEGAKPELSIDLHDGTDEQMTIIVVHKDRPEYLNICLQSITVTSYNNNYEIIVVDNGSTEESKDYLREIEKDGVKVVYNEKNLFWSEACNRGAAAANKKSKWFIFMHCDVAILKPEWLDLFLNVAEMKKSGLVGVDMSTYSISGDKIDFIPEWLILMSRECFDAIGGWPSKLPQIGHAFIVTIAATSKGFSPQVMNHPVAHHYKIFSLDISEYERMTESALLLIPSHLEKANSTSLEAKIN